MLLNHLLDPAAAPSNFFFWTDFIRQDAVADGGDTDFTAIASGTGVTQAGNGGILRIGAVATTDDSGGQVQALAAHVCTDGKSMGFKTKLQLGESTSTNVATESEFWVGLFPVDTSIVASLPADGIYFEKDDGGTTLKCVVRVAGVNVASVTTSITVDKLAHHYGIAVYPNGSSSWADFSVDGVRVARVTDIAMPASTVVLTPSVAFQSGDNTGTKFLDVDYLGSFQQR